MRAVCFASGPAWGAASAQFLREWVCCPRACRSVCRHDKPRASHAHALVRAPVSPCPAGLSHLEHLRCLYLQQNVLKEIRNLDGLGLVTLNLSQNLLTKVTGLDKLPNLETLNLAKNNIRTVEDIEHLAQCAAVTTLDLSGNKLEDPAVLEVFKRMPNLCALYLKGNPMVRQIKHYRKTLVNELPKLTYLDDRPVFELERVAANAWSAGGHEAEVAARKSPDLDSIKHTR